MSYEIPEPFAWDETFRVFYEDLDESRKNLFKSLFAVATDRSDAAALSNFVATVTRFLANEEEEGKATRGNDEFVNVISKLTTPVTDDNIDYAKKWLVNRIQRDGDGRHKNKV